MANLFLKRKVKKEIEKESVGLANGSVCSSSYDSGDSCYNDRNI